MAREGAHEGLEVVDRLDPRAEASADDRLDDPSGVGLDQLAVLAHQDHAAGVIALGHRAARHLGDGGVAIGDHRQGVEVHAAVLGLQDLVEEAAHALAPLLAEVFKVLHRLVGVHEDEARRPAILAVQLRQVREDPGCGILREAVDRHHLDVLPADAGDHAAPHLLGPDHAVEIQRVGGQVDGLADAGGAELQPAQELVLDEDRTILVLNLHGPETRQRQAHAQPGFKSRGVPFELLDQLGRAHLAADGLPVVVEHQLGELLGRQHLRKEGDGDDEIAFVHAPLALEELAAFLVDGLRHPIGEFRSVGGRIARGHAAHAVHMDHPAVAEARQGLVDPR